MSLGIVFRVKLTPAGEERARLVREGGEGKVFGKHLPLRQLSVVENGISRTYLIGPVREGGKDERLLSVEIGMRR